MLSERIQTEIDKYCMISLMCGIKKSNFFFFGHAVRHVGS